jgi:hypothetical protein
MKEAGEILRIILETIASIYKRPRMHAATAGEVDTCLWHLHFLWAEITEPESGDFRATISTVHGRRHKCNLPFSAHYRHHTEKGAEAGKDQVIQYVISMWKKLDDKLGIEVPAIG